MRQIKVITALLCLFLTLTLLTGCDNQQEYYNAKDKKDFQYGNSVKFQIIQFKQVIDEKTLKQSKIKGNYFLIMGSISGVAKEEKAKSNVYYCYLQNKNGAIYFAKIPTEKVRIYEDAKEPCLVGYQEGTGEFEIDVNDENKWDEYNIFNLHIPKGTIIPRVNLDINLIKE